MKHALLTAAKGFCMGAADVVPGVSGGTMALILGIYSRLLAAISGFRPSLLGKLRRAEWGAFAAQVDLGFLLALFVGIAAALGVFTRVIPLPELIRTDPVPIYSLFFGLIVGSVIVLLCTHGRLRAADYGFVAFGCALGLWIVTLVPTETPEESWFIFLSGAIAICAMVLPGISGSFVLLLLRKYSLVLDAVGHLKLSVLVPFGAGALVGLLAFVRLLTWLLDRFQRPTFFTISGLLIGSLWVVWPFQERTYELVRGKSKLVHTAPVLPAEVDALAVMAAGIALFGALLVVGLDYLARSGRTASPRKAA